MHVSDASCDTAYEIVANYMMSSGYAAAVCSTVLAIKRGVHVRLNMHAHVLRCEAVGACCGIWLR
jgi:hypothetical protein